MFTEFERSEHRAQMAEMEVEALENLIANLQAKMDTQSRMGAFFAGLGPSISRYSEMQAIAREVLAARLAVVEAMVADALKPETVVVPTPADNLRVRTMRRFYAVAKAAGLDVKNAEGMTWALAKYFRCIIPSRAILSPGQWAEAIVAVEMRLMAW